MSILIVEIVTKTLIGYFLYQFDVNLFFAYLVYTCYDFYIMAQKYFMALKNAEEIKKMLKGDNNGKNEPKN